MKLGSRFAAGIGVVLLCLMSGVVGGALSKSLGASNYIISYADFISIILTAISLLMTLLAFFIAMLAYIGWGSISGKVASDVKAYLADGFKEGQPLHRMLVEQKDKAMFEGILEIDQEFQDAGADADVDDRKDQA